MEYGSHQISKNWAITVCIIRNQIFNIIYVGRHLHLAILLKGFQKKVPKKIQFPTYEQQFQIIKNEIKQVRLS